MFSKVQDHVNRQALCTARSAVPVRGDVQPLPSVQAIHPGTGGVSGGGEASALLVIPCELIHCHDWVRGSPTVRSLSPAVGDLDLNEASWCSPVVQHRLGMADTISAPRSIAAIHIPCLRNGTKSGTCNTRQPRPCRSGPRFNGKRKPCDPMRHWQPTRPKTGFCDRSSACLAIDAELSRSYPRLSSMKLVSM